MDKIVVFKKIFVGVKVLKDFIEEVISMFLMLINFNIVNVLKLR